MRPILETKGKIQLVGLNASTASPGSSSNSFSEFLQRKGLLAAHGELGVRKIVCINYSPKFKSQVNHSDINYHQRTLVRMEPSVVLPANFSRARRKQFGKVITVGGGTNPDSLTVRWPLVFPSETERGAIFLAERAERIVLINGNKISFIKGELYSLRRKAIRSIKNLDLYGTDWDSKSLPRLVIAIRSLSYAILNLRVPTLSGIALWFQNYSLSKGPVGDKLATMSKYKYALVVENSEEYMSEKLMEALFAGCIPIYVGPDPKEHGVPNSLVIWSKPNLKSIQSSLAEAATWDSKDFHSRLKVFLSSSETRDSWDSEKVYQKMLDIIEGNR
jgi:hypothetical protein